MFDEEYQNRAVERDQTRALGVGQRYVLHELRKILSGESDEEIRARVMLFDRVFRDAVTNAVRRELNMIRRNGLVDSALLTELARIYQDHRLRDRPERQEQGDDLTARVVCSLSLR